MEAPDQIEALAPRPALFRAVAVSQDGRRLAAGSGDGLITFWDLRSRQELATFAHHQRGLTKLAFLDDCNTLVSIGLDQITIWPAPPFWENRP